MDELTLTGITELAEKYSRRAHSWMSVSNLFTKHIYMIYSGLEKKDFNELWSGRDDICYMINGKGFSGRDAVYACYVEAKDAVRMGLLESLAKLIPNESFTVEKKSGAGEYELHVPMVPYIQIAGDNQTAKAIWNSPGVACHVNNDGTCHSYVGTQIYSVDFINEAGEWKIWHLKEDDEFAAEVPLSFEATIQNAISGKKLKVGGGPPKLVKETVLNQLANGECPNGRTGEIVRTLKDLPPASPESNLHMVDRPTTSLDCPNRFIDDIVEPYDSWDEKLSVIRSYDL